MSCSNCGKCCFFPSGEKNPDGTLILKACRFLILKNGVSTCRIYRNRLGTVVSVVGDTAYICSIYNSMDEEIKGCPLNTGTKPLRIVEIVDRKKAISPI